MTSDEIIQKLGISIYEEPLCSVRDESDFPDVDNPFHLTVLLIDCDTEIAMNGMLGFLENSTGEHLLATIHALIRIGANSVAEHLGQVQQCMSRHGVTWERLRGDFEGTQEYQITSFRALHGETIDAFAKDVAAVASGFDLFNHPSKEPVYQMLCAYLDQNIDSLRYQLRRREPKQQRT